MNNLERQIRDAMREDARVYGSRQRSMELGGGKDPSRSCKSRSSLLPPEQDNIGGHAHHRTRKTSKATEANLKYVAYIRELRASGMTYEQVALEVGITLPRVVGICNKYGIEVGDEQVREARALSDVRSTAGMGVSAAESGEDQDSANALGEEKAL